MTREERESAVDWFAERMKQKLRKPENEAKGGWREDPFLNLLSRLNEERKELVAEICDDDKYSFDYEAIMNEAADVANFAMFIADRALQLSLTKLEKRLSGKSDEV